MVDSRSSLGASPVAWIAACWESFQLSLFQRRLPLPSLKLRNGSASTPGTLYGGWARVDPRPRTTTDLEPVPAMVNPAIVTPGPGWTEARVEKLVILGPGRICSVKLWFAAFPHFHT